MTTENSSRHFFDVETARHPDVELQELRDVFGNGECLHSQDRIMNPELSAQDAASWLIEKVASEKLQGKYIALVAGGFDVPHDNHEWYIRHCRMATAKHMLQQNGEDVTPESVMKVMSSGMLSLMVSIDSDVALNARKGGLAEKGGIARPVYPWTSRSQRIGGYTYVDPRNGSIHHTADIITRECTVDYSDTPLACAATTAMWLKQYDLLDSYIVFDEHPQDILNAEQMGFDPIVIQQSVIYARDPRNNKEFKSSGIINQIRGNS